MKLLPILAAAAATTLAIPAATAVAAPAAPAATVAKVEIQHHRRSYHRKRAYYRTVCTTKWRHGHRYRTCRKVRYYR